MRKSIYLLLGLFLMVTLGYADWQVDVEGFDTRVDFDSVVTFKDTTFHGGAVVCSSNVKMEDTLTLELAIINQMVGWDDERKICLVGESPPDVGFYNDNVGGQYSFWENSEPFELAFKISNAKWDSTVWGRRDSIDIYKKLIFKADTNYVSSICEYRWQSGGERVGPYVQAIGTSNDRDPAYLGYFICDEGTYTKVLELHYDSVKIKKPTTIEDKLYVKDTTFHGGVVVDSNRHLCLAPLFITESNTTVDTSFYIKKYGARTGYIGLVFDVDTSENTAANVKLIDISGSNALDGQTDFWLYMDANNYWNAGGDIRTTRFLINSEMLFMNSAAIKLYANTDYIFQWNAVKKGDIIFRDGNLGVANADFFQIQDSAGTDVVYQVSNTGDVAMDGGVNYAADAQGDDDYEVAIPSIDALVAGLTITFLANTANTDAATLEITSVGDLDAILKHSDQALVTGDVEAGQIVVVVWDGSNWQMTSQLAQ